MRGNFSDPLSSLTHTLRISITPLSHFFCNAYIQIITILAALTLPIAGCVSVTSEKYVDVQRDRKSGRSSFAYMLPKAVVPVQLLERDGVFAINVLAPKYLGDPQHPYIVSYSPSPFSSDSVDVVVGSNALLSSVNVTADDQTGQFLINLAKSYAAITAGVPGLKENSTANFVPISSFDVDPDDSFTLEAANAAFTSAALEQIDLGISRNCHSDDAAKIETCRTYKNIRRKKLTIHVSIHPPVFTPQVKLPDCTVGLCFRLPIPYRVTAGFAVGKRVSASSTFVALPNRAPVFAVNFDRTAFVRKVNNATFVNGMLTGLHVEKPSEAAAIALLPAQMISAFFSTIASTFQSRTAALNAEKEYIEAFMSLDSARKEAFSQQKPLLSVQLGSDAPRVNVVGNQAEQNPSEQVVADSGSGSNQVSESSPAPGNSPGSDIFDQISNGCEDPNNC